MFDILMIVLLVVAMAAAVGYVYACISLTEPASNGQDKTP